MTIDKGFQIAWNTVVGVTFLAVIGVAMVATQLVKK
jgi:hypothetical protein